MPSVCDIVMLFSKRGLCDKANKSHSYIGNNNEVG